MSIIDRITEKVKDEYGKIQDKKAFRDTLIEAVNDGELSIDEITKLDKQKEELGLSEKDIKGISADAYAAALTATKMDGKITQSEVEELEKIQNYLGLDDREISNKKEELTRLRLLTEIQEGNIPTLIATNIVTQKDEKIYWIETSSLLEESVVNRRYAGGSRGVSFRIVKGVNYRIGGHKGHYEVDKENVEVSSGKLIITNKRIIFSGDKKSFSTGLDKIIDISLFTNGLRFSEINKNKPRLIKFEKKENQEILGAILSSAINHFGEVNKF